MPHACVFSHEVLSEEGKRLPYFNFSQQYKMTVFLNIKYDCFIVMEVCTWELARKIR